MISTNRKPVVTSGNHLERPSALSVDEGNFYWETDTNTMFVMKITAGARAWTECGGSGAGASAYGDGSDGALGLNAPLTLARDMYFTTLALGPAAVLDTAGFRVYAKDEITVNTGGVIRNNGSSAALGAHGAGAPGGTVEAGGNGGDGGNNGAGVAGAAQLNVMVSPIGGNGGAGGAATNAGGAGGANTTTAAAGSLHRFDSAISGTDVGFFPGAGAGGGGGGSSVGTATGGGGGGGGGIVFLAAPIIDNNGVVEALGGTGADGFGTAGDAGGGGGGGGGIIIMVGKSVINTGARTVTGGTHGAGFNAGAPGVSGSAGATYTFLDQ